MGMDSVSSSSSALFPTCCFLYACWSQARSLVKKLQSSRSPAADLLEQRITLIERCQVLGFKKIKQLARSDLISHVTSIENSKLLPLPFRLRLDIMERLCDETMLDYLQVDPAGRFDPAQILDELCGRFQFWEHEDDQDVSELKLSIGQVLIREEGRLQCLEKTGELGDSEMKEAIQQSQQDRLCGYAGNLGA